MKLENKQRHGSYLKDEETKTEDEGNYKGDISRGVEGDIKLETKTAYFAPYPHRHLLKYQWGHYEERVSSILSSFM